MNCYNVWKITGVNAKTRNLETFYCEGYLDFIAFNLGHEYTHMFFVPVEIQKVVELNPKKEPVYEISVSVPNTDPSTTEAAVIMDMMHSRNVDVVPAEDHHSVKLVRRLTKRQQAQKELNEIFKDVDDVTQRRIYELMEEVLR